jgi:hypothetical protein
LVIDDLSAARDNILADLLKDVLKLAALGGFIRDEVQGYRLASFVPAIPAAEACPAV